MFSFSLGPAVVRTTPLLVGILWASLAIQLGHAQQTVTPKSGINLQNMNESVRPQDDFYRYVNGRWLEAAEIPADHTVVGGFTDLSDRAVRDVQSIIDGAKASTDRTPGSAAQQIADLYASLMNEDLIEKLGAKPLGEEIAKIEAMQTSRDLAQRIGDLAVIGVGGAYDVYRISNSRP